MDNNALLLIAGMMLLSMSAAIGLLILWAANSSSEKEDDDTTQTTTQTQTQTQVDADEEEEEEEEEEKQSGGGSGTGEWKKATATFYHSYPPCCPDSPTYSSGASKSECDDYSGCKWMGQFAAVGKKSYDWVKSNDIAAFFETGGAGSWKSKWANKSIQIRNPSSGKTMNVLIADTCGDGDCGGCCTANANKNGGTLIDLEYHTAKRFWGSSVPGLTSIEWRPAS